MVAPTNDSQRLEVGKVLCIITYDGTMRRASLVHFFDAALAVLGH